MGCDTRINPEAFKVKGALLSSSGMIGIIIQSYALSGTYLLRSACDLQTLLHLKFLPRRRLPALSMMDTDSVHIVEIRRGKGDILEYYKLYNELVTTKINTIINLPPNFNASGAAEQM